MALSFSEIALLISEAHAKTLNYETLDFLSREFKAFYHNYSAQIEKHPSTLFTDLQGTIYFLDKSLHELSTRPRTSNPLLLKLFNFQDQIKARAMMRSMSWCLSSFVQASPEVYGQKVIMDRMAAAGYHISTEGLCYGISHMSLQAFLDNDMHSFNHRLKQIYSTPVENFKDNCANLRRQYTALLKEGKHQQATELNQTIIDFMAFFDGVVLHQAPYNQQHLFDNPIYGQDAQRTMEMILPDTLKVEGKNPCIIKAFAGTYTKEELVEYLTLLQHHLGEKSFALSLHSTGHSINLNYNCETKRWLLVDPNILPGQEYIHPELLANRLMYSYGQKKGLVLSTVIYTTQQNEPTIKLNYKQLENTKIWQKLHAKTHKIYTSYGIDASNRIIHEASKNHDFSLAKEAISMHRLDKEQASFLLGAACKQNNLEMIDFFINHGVSVPSDLIETIAMQPKHLHILKIIIKQALLQKIIIDKEGIEHPINNNEIKHILASALDRALQEKLKHVVSKEEKNMLQKKLHIEMQIIFSIIDEINNSIIPTPLPMSYQPKIEQLQFELIKPIDDINMIQSILTELDELISALEINEAFLGKQKNFEDYLFIHSTVNSLKEILAYAKQNPSENLRFSLDQSIKLLELFSHEKKPSRISLALADIFNTIKKLFYFALPNNTSQDICESIKINPKMSLDKKTTLIKKKLEQLQTISAQESEEPDIIANNKFKSQ